MVLYNAIIKKYGESKVKNMFAEKEAEFSAYFDDKSNVSTVLKCLKDIGALESLTIWSFIFI